MRERPYLDEHSELVSAGLLAEEVVFAARALRDRQAVDTAARRALESARELLRFAVSPTIAIQDVPPLNALSPGQGALEALRALEVEAADSDLQKFVEELASVITAGLEGDDVSARTDVLDALQRIFASIGDVALARANSLALPQHERFAWPSATKTSIS